MQRQVSSLLQRLAAVERELQQERQKGSQQEADVSAYYALCVMKWPSIHVMNCIGRMFLEIRREIADDEWTKMKTLRELSQLIHQTL